MEMRPIRQMKDGRLLVLYLGLVVLVIADLFGSLWQRTQKVDNTRYGYQLIEQEGITRLSITESTINPKIPTISVHTDEGNAIFFFSPINVNKAQPELLQAIPGVGPGLAQRIVQYRDEQGPLTNLAELKAIPGIGEKRAVALQDKIYFGEK